MLMHKPLFYTIVSTTYYLIVSNKQPITTVDVDVNSTKSNLMFVQPFKIKHKKSFQQIGSTESSERVDTFGWKLDN